MTFSVHGYELRSDVMRAVWAKGWAEGWAKGHAEALLTVLERLGVAVPDKIRDQVLGCTDLAQLETWLTNAATVGDIVRC
jgi:hypothetical protein